MSPTCREQFVDELEFELDAFQAQALDSIDAGFNTLVSAPTGSGKTLVGEYAAYQALQADRRCFYTTPIKALSNQKFRQFTERFGAANIGLLTGDHSIRPWAPIVVMTTEVLRNMIYAGSDVLEDLGTVVMDEIHYLADRSRGVVWEEVILTLDREVRLVGLSATVSNADQLGQWLSDTRGHTEVVRSTKRPVPLAHLLFTRGDLVPISAVRNTRRHVETDGESSQRFRTSGLWAKRGEVLEVLNEQRLLPCIFFIFSRAGCDGAAQQLVKARKRFTTEVEAAAIGKHFDAAVVDVPALDLDALDYKTVRGAAVRGIAAHHAGMLPLFRTIIEELFTDGLLKVVFATETMALGIHMPARSVVLEKLTKFNGDDHVTLTASEYSQITGRAGRRGLDSHGSAVVIDSPGLPLGDLQRLVDSPSFPLRSAFRPDYSMTVNLVDSLGYADAASVLGRSFAQFQTNRDLVGRATTLKKRAQDRDALREKLNQLGADEDFFSYMSLRSFLKTAEKQASAETKNQRRSDIAEAMRKIRPGNVVAVHSKRLGTVAAVLEARTESAADPAFFVFTDTGWKGWIRPTDFSAPPVLVTTVDLPGKRGLNRRQAANLRRELEHSKHRARGKSAKNKGRGPGTKRDSSPRRDPKIASMRKQLTTHRWHSHDNVDRLARVYERWAFADRDVTTMQRNLDSDSNSLVTQFRRHTDLLTGLGYLAIEDPTEPDNSMVVTDQGRSLALIHAQDDLLIAECLRRGAWSGLDSAGLSATIAAIVTRSRNSNEVREPNLPDLQDSLNSTADIAAELRKLEATRGIDATGELDLGLSPAIHHWVSGGSLSSILAASWQEGVDLTAGDFVRAARLVVDVLMQVNKVADPALARSARQAVDKIRRGVVDDKIG